MVRIVIAVVGVACLAMAGIGAFRSAELRKEVGRQIKQELEQESRKPPQAARVIYEDPELRYVDAEAKAVAAGEVWFLFPRIVWILLGLVLLLAVVLLSALGRRKRQPQSVRQ